MTQALWIATVSIVLEGVVLLLLPNLTPSQMYFGIRTGAAFRGTEFGRRVRRQYRLQVLAWLALSAVLMMAESSGSELPAAIGSMLPFVGAAVAFVRAYRQVRPHAQPLPAIREADLSPRTPDLPRWSWLALPPFAVPLAIMLYVRAHWDEIPARFPSHFNGEGRPDRWVERSERTVFAPFWFTEGMLLLFLLLFVAILLGSRKMTRPTAIPGIIVGAMYMMSVFFSATGLTPLWQPPAGVLIALTVAFVTGAIVWAYRRNSDPRLPAEPTPDDCWTLGSFYVNPNDPALFVQKRVGFGYTINLGNVWTYVFFGGFMLGMFGLTFFLKWAMGS